MQRDSLLAQELNRKKCITGIEFLTRQTQG